MSLLQTSAASSLKSGEIKLAPEFEKKSLSRMVLIEMIYYNSVFDRFDFLLPSQVHLSQVRKKMCLTVFRSNFEAACT